MSDDNQNIDIDAVKEEMCSAATNSITHILQYLADFYGKHIPDDVELNKEFMRVLTCLVGDMLGTWPEEDKEAITEFAYGNIAYTQDLTETSLARISEPSDEVQEIRQYDLSKMKPVGNA